MGQCMKDHPLKDVLEKLEEVKTRVESTLYEQVKQHLQVTSFTQEELNEWFHAIKKLEKTLDELERERAIGNLYKLM